MFLELPDLTIVGVDAIHPAQTLRAIHFSMRQVKFGAAVIVTQEPLPEYCLRGVKNLIANVGGARINRERALVLDFHKWFSTPFALHVESDALVANAFGWKMAFLNYDYIGAPWPYPTPLEGFPNSSAENCVGNFGLALISKRMSESIAKHTPADEPRVEISDAWICRCLRSALQADGMKFAPEEIAARFSCENQIYSGQFGIHGAVTLDMNGMNLETLDRITW